MNEDEGVSMSRSRAAPAVLACLLAMSPARAAVTIDDVWIQAPDAPGGPAIEIRWTKTDPKSVMFRVACRARGQLDLEYFYLEHLEPEDFAALSGPLTLMLDGAAHELPTRVLGVQDVAARLDLDAAMARRFDVAQSVKVRTPGAASEPFEIKGPVLTTFVRNCARV